MVVVFCVDDCETSNCVCASWRMHTYFPATYVTNFLLTCAIHIEVHTYITTSRLRSQLAFRGRTSSGPCIQSSNECTSSCIEAMSTVTKLNMTNMSVTAVMMTSREASSTFTCSRHNSTSSFSRSGIGGGSFCQ